MTDPREELAIDVLELLRLQQVYFKGRRTEDLQACKKFEGVLKRKCAEILDPPPPPVPTLFTPEAV